MAETLTVEVVREAIRSGAGALRAVTDLQPAGGDGDKVFPPTYEGGKYATEQRLIDGTRVPCVILDSVQSQANRLELTLLDACRRGAIPLPLVQLDFGLATDPDVHSIGLLTALEAPHRLADAYFLASEVEEDGVWKPFRHRNTSRSSALGARFETASPANATPLLEMCPSVLLFGMWDSHGTRGGMGQRLQRALVSEIVGIDVQMGVRPASRIDPVIPATADVRVEDTPDGWRVLERGTRAKKLSEVGLGNVTPSLANHKTGELHHGGVSLRLARQIAVLSLPALRRLRFPVDAQGARQDSEAVDVAAQTVLAALAMAAVAWQWRTGFDLRSRCLLVPQHDLRIELVGPTRTETFGLDPDAAAALVKAAVANVMAAGLTWRTDPSTLRPNEELVKAVKRSRELAAVAEAG